MINVRLWIEYGLVAVLLAVGSVAITNWVKASVQEQKIETLNIRLDTAAERLDTAETVNSTQQSVILDLANQRKVDGERIVELIDTYSSLSQSDKLLRNQLRSLEKKDAAKNYLDMPMPDDAGCVYDGSCPPESPGAGEGGQGNSPIAPAPTVRPSTSSP